MSLLAGSASAGTGLAGALYAAGIAGSPATNVITPGAAASYRLCDWIAATVVDYLVKNAVVLPSLLVAPSGGGPVTGTGAIE